MFENYDVVVSNYVWKQHEIRIFSAFSLDRLIINCIVRNFTTWTFDIVIISNMLRIIDVSLRIIMLISYDNSVDTNVVHSSFEQMKKIHSFAIVVASIDKHLTQWFSFLQIQHREHKEVDVIMRNDILELMMIERLKEWQNNNNEFLFERILMYRDDVSKSQYEKVLSTEISIFFETFKKLNKNEMKVVFIIVEKRHHTRFYFITIKNSNHAYNFEKEMRILDRKQLSICSFRQIINMHKRLTWNKQKRYYEKRLKFLFSNTWLSQRHRKICSLCRISQRLQKHECEKA